MEQILNTILLYSLAFGLILALLTGLTLVLTRSSSPILRYRILVTLLGLFTAGIVVTGAVTLRDLNTAAATGVQVSAQKETKTLNVNTTDNTALSAVTNDLITLSRNFMNNNARTIALIWIFIVLAKSIKLSSNLFELHYLKTRQIYPAGRHWEEQLSKLSRQIGLNKTVRIMQSGLTQVPLVIGHFKPVILIPLGMITAIKPKEIEMMILHELAHIKRMDFLVNMLQHVLELLFFFNPAVLWTSALIRKERENCCDEVVLQNADEKHSYIQALLSFKEYQLNVPAYAMAFAKESNLVKRVKRMVYQKNTALNSIEKGCMLIAVMLLCSFSVLRSTDPALKMVKYQEPVVKKGKSSAKPASAPQKSAPEKQKKEHPAPKISPPAATIKSKAAVEDKGEPEISMNINSNTNTSGNVSVNIDNKLIQNLATNLTTTVLSAINMALDSSLHYSSVTLNADPQAKLNPIAAPTPKVKLSPSPKVEAKTSDLTQDLIRALEKAGIDTKGEQFRFHISNKELTVNGKKQTDAVKNAVLKNFLKSPEDSIDFSYNRDGKSVSTVSSYHTK
ncbi:MAG TPA: M56 family metallopeptidase [Pedobacter sp.]|uniref:M56 family metallopeptidase n=1 Tax=Pedobacter sp. TaxID=1411316 RepID=UPI002C53C708|nr:M56 family metallopeptidase [Pedobacter sp.]HMI05042.1 M56 family metallopeptidase [Pedobacter sp.]